jgi:cysteine synthase A
MNIYSSLTDLIGNTPLLELHRYNAGKGLQARLTAKLEYFNPLGSVKDRVAYAMLQDAEERGLIGKDTVIIESTSGNTGIGLAFVCASQNRRLLLTMPESMSKERRDLLKALGATLILTPEKEGMRGAIKRAEELAAKNNYYMPGQFKNPNNPGIHRKTTAEEIYRDISENSGEIAAFVCGVGTGGTITGIGEFLKEKNPDIKIIAVEPFNSAVLSGNGSGSHKIQGIGAGFIPELLNIKIIDEIIKVKDEDAFAESRLLAKTEGLIVGISSGAAAYASVEIASRPEYKNKTIVTLFPDTGERYLSSGLYE